MSNKNIMTTIGACNYRQGDRQLEDFYATDPIAIDKLENKIEIPHICYECACGEGHLSKRLEHYGHKVFSTDLINRNYGIGGIDFLKIESLSTVFGKEIKNNDICIITNPPFKYATEFVLRSLEAVLIL